jgi:hypothetical protein
MFQFFIITAIVLAAAGAIGCLINGLNGWFRDRCLGFRLGKPNFGAYQMLEGEGARPWSIASLICGFVFVILTALLTTGYRSYLQSPSYFVHLFPMETGTVVEEFTWTDEGAEVWMTVGGLPEQVYPRLKTHAEKNGWKILEEPVRNLLLRMRKGNWLADITVAERSAGGTETRRDENGRLEEQEEMKQAPMTRIGVVLRNRERAVP